MMNSLPLFPDLLDRTRAIGTDKQRIWSLDQVGRRDSPLNELRDIRVMYQDPAMFIPPQPKAWVLVIWHHFYQHVIEKRGYPRCDYHCRVYERRFYTREEVIDAAERVLCRVQSYKATATQMLEDQG